MRISFLVLVFASVAAVISFTAGRSRADSHQIATSSTANSPDEAQYQTWPKGAGKVHAQAKVDPSVIVDAESKVGPFVRIDAGVKLRKAILMGQSEAAPAHVGAGAVIDGSSLQGAFDIGAKAIITKSMLQGPITVAGNRKITACTLSAMNPATIQADMSDQMSMLTSGK